MTQSQTRLWKGDAFVADPWRHAEADDGYSHVILPLASFLGMDEKERTAAASRIGVHLAPGDSLNAIVPYLGDLPLIALSFPAFNDGRSHSKAALLKGRHRFGGELRATGDILVDQLPLLIRNGFDALEVENPVAQGRLENGIDTSVRVYGQPASVPDLQTNAYSWRRIARSAT